MLLSLPPIRWIIVPRGEVQQDESLASKLPAALMNISPTPNRDVSLQGWSTLEEWLHLVLREIPADCMMPLGGHKTCFKFFTPLYCVCTCEHQTHNSMKQSHLWLVDTAGLTSHLTPRNPLSLDLLRLKLQVCQSTHLINIYVDSGVLTHVPHRCLDMLSHWAITRAWNLFFQRILSRKGFSK